MSKFIDADRLRAEIERRFWDYGTPLHDDEVTTKVNEVLSIIDSLQQEQPEVDLEEEMTAYFKDWYILETDQGYILKTQNGNAVVGDVKNVARHFFNLGLNARK